MIAILQLDSVSLPLIKDLLNAGHLPALETLRKKGTWLTLETPAEYFEGSGSYAIYTGTGVGVNGQYYPWLWSAAEQRVRFMDDFPIPETVWERIGHAGRRSLIIDPYEIRPPQTMQGTFLSGWQFKNRVVLRSCSLPRDILGSLARTSGPPPLGEEVYGRPSAPQLLRLRQGLLAAPPRLAAATTELLKREPFDLVWITASAAHLAGHRFLDMSQVSGAIDLKQHRELETTLMEIYRSTDEAMGRILAALPSGADVLVVSPAGMGANTSRSHLLPNMIKAVLSGGSGSNGDSAPSRSLLWRIRSLVPTGLRAWIAGALPDRWAIELATRLELKGVDWPRTLAFMMPNDDAGFVRLNLRGRERDGIVDPQDADELLDKIAAGLKTFRDPDGRPAVRKVVRVTDLGMEGPSFTHLPDLVVQWNDRCVEATAGVNSPQYGDVPSNGWGTGRTGSHTCEAWALLAPSDSSPKRLSQPPHIIDIAATVCTLLGADAGDLKGQALLER
jgi:predicted AlkP superfamily phosphohydrolase/phosphomutase